MNTNSTLLAALSLIFLNFSQYAVSATTERAVRIVIVPTGRLDLPGPHYRTGSVIPAAELNTILFLKEPCPLEIAGRENMLRAWQALGAYQVGCWFPTEDGQYVVIDGLGTARGSRAYWEAQPRALLHANGTATITEPGYDSETFGAQVSQRKMMEIFRHRNEKP